MIYTWTSIVSCESDSFTTFWNAFEVFEHA